MKIKLFIPIFAVLLYSCSKSEELIPSTKDFDLVDGVSLIPIEKALSSLEIFMQDITTSPTKGTKRKIVSIDTYYTNNFATKSTSQVPQAYLVNFENNQGYAILGANSNITSIICFVEKGNITWEEIMPTEDTTGKTKVVGGDIYIDPNFDNDGDVLAPGIPYNSIVSMCIQSALINTGGSNPTPPSSTPTTPLLIEPLLGTDYPYSQQETYCHIKNGKIVVNGCCSTAISILIAYFKRHILYIDREYLKYSMLNSMDGKGIKYSFADNSNFYINLNDYFTNASELTKSKLDTLNLIKKIDSGVFSAHGTPTFTSSNFYRSRFKLTSGVFYNLTNIVASWDGTGVMPNAALKGMSKFGFGNAKKRSSLSLDSEHINNIKTMLKNNKPVLICGWSFFKLSNSHYWIIDGIREKDNDIHVRCNWGWGGNSDGWFSKDCLKASSPIIDTKFGGNKNVNNGWKHIIVYTYNKPAAQTLLSSSEFYNKYRRTY